ncbi:hypothetical protein E4U45_007430 [Claviceps purpurea]|nr:hypothetical protein E4U45_007430 [Claviceps purpurea]
MASSAEAEFLSGDACLLHEAAGATSCPIRRLVLIHNTKILDRRDQSTTLSEGHSILEG